MFLDGMSVVQIGRPVLTFAMLIDSLHAAFEHAEIALDGVRVDDTANVTVLAMASV